MNLNLTEQNPIVLPSCARTIEKEYVRAMQDPEKREQLIRFLKSRGLLSDPARLPA